MIISFTFKMNPKEEGIKMRILILTMVMLLLVSCGKDGQKKEANYKIFEKDGYQTIVNKNKPARGELKLEKKLALEFALPDSIKAEIGSTFDINMLEIDNQGNFYILLSRTSKIYKFNPKGEYQLSFGHRGQGPGEFNDWYQLDIKQDTIVVYNREKNLLIKYSSQGKLVDELTPASNSLSNLEIMGADYLSASTSMSTEGAAFILKEELILMDEQGKEKKNIVAKSKKFDFTKYNPGLGFRFTSTNKNLYLAKNSDREFQIDKYNGLGEKILEIKRNYIKVPYTAEEKEELAKRYNVSVNGESKKIDFEIGYKQAINYLFADKYERIWVEAASLENNQADSLTRFEIYDKSGIYQYNFKAKEEFRFLADKLVLYEDGKIKVYDY